MNKSASLVLLACLAGLTAQAQSLRPSTQLRPVPGAALAMTGGQRAADYIVAVVNSEPVTNSEVRSRMVRIEQQLTQQGAALPPRDELARQVLERIIGEHAQLQVARDNVVKVDEPAIDQAVRNVAHQNQLEVAELRRRVEADGMTWARFRDDMRDQILLTRVREREVDPTVKVTEQDIDQFIREQQDSTDLSTMDINLGQILIAVPENAPADQVSALQARGQQVLTRARAGEDFAKLAGEFSESRDKAVGGVLGLRAADRYPPLFVEATRSLPVGAFAPLLRSGAGFHILKVIEKKQAGLPGVAVTQTRARHILLRTGNQVPESAAIARLAEFKRRIEAGQADFAALARENSQDGSAKDGGELGWTNPGQFVPEFEEVMNGLAPGQLAEPLVSRFGVHLIQVEERREATLSQREQRDIARNLVREKKLDEAYNNWVRDVRGRAYVELREPPQAQ